MDLIVTRITDKAEGLDIKGQGCGDDCERAVWVGNSSFSTEGCRIYVEKTASSTYFW